MCGLFGWQFKDRSNLPSLLPVAAGILVSYMCDRGTDSWGVLTDNCQTAHGLGSLDSARMARKLHHYPTVAAHTRLGTTGAISIANAHPFTVGNIVGMHNGMVYNHEALNVLFKRDCDVDSMHIFHHINDGEDASDIQAYGAIVYARRDTPGDLFMGRFNSGELSVARISKNGTLLGVMWASTTRALYHATDMAGFKTALVEVKQGKLYRISQGDIWSTAQALDYGNATYSSRAGASTSASWRSEDPNTWNGWSKVYNESGTISYFPKGASDGMSDNVSECSDVWAASCETCGMPMYACNCENCFCQPCVDCYSAAGINVEDRYCELLKRGDTRGKSQLSLPSGSKGDD